MLEKYDLKRKINKVFVKSVIALTTLTALFFGKKDKVFAENNEPTIEINISETGKAGVSVRGFINMNYCILIKYQVFGPCKTSEGEYYFESSEDGDYEVIYEEGETSSCNEVEVVYETVAPEDFYYEFEIKEQGKKVVTVNLDYSDSNGSIKSISKTCENGKDLNSGQTGDEKNESNKPQPGTVSLANTSRVTFRKMPGKIYKYEDKSKVPTYDVSDNLTEKSKDKRTLTEKEDDNDYFLLVLGLAVTTFAICVILKHGKKKGGLEGV